MSIGFSFKKAIDRSKLTLR